MQLKVSLKFSDAQRIIITDFAKQIGMNVPEFCKRAVFYSINDSYRRAEEQGVQRDPTAHTDSGRDSSTVLESQASDSAALAES